MGELAGGLILILATGLTVALKEGKAALTARRATALELTEPTPERTMTDDRKNTPPQTAAR